MLLGAGLLHGSRILSYEQLLMDCEIWSILQATFKGIEVTSETLALDTIRAVGPGGNFLGQRHTRQHMRERWLPSLLDRRPYRAWEEKRDGARQWAGDQARQMLGEIRPELLEPALQQELTRIIAEAERQFLAG
jgi:trimethylamine--corrinoid protein Co-methyltransferase